VAVESFWLLLAGWLLAARAVRWLPSAVCWLACGLLLPAAGCCCLLAAG
jgi:hypothetical protein